MDPAEDMEKHEEVKRLILREDQAGIEAWVERWESLRLRASGSSRQREEMGAQSAARGGEDGPSAAGLSRPTPSILPCIMLSVKPKR